MQLTTLHETENLIVINKPAGLVVHGDGKSPEPTVADWFIAHYPESQGVGESLEIEHAGKKVPINRSGIVHRIDRDTSGCLIVCKNQKTFEMIKEQFQNHTIKKKYLAVTFGWIREDRGIIDQPIGRSSADIRTWTTKRTARGVLRNAITRYVVKKRFEYQGQKYTLVDLYPETGRTHQLRVHMNHLGHPLVGDPLYASKKTTQLPITRTALHAEKITFSDNGAIVEVIAPLPEDLAKIVSLC